MQPEQEECVSVTLLMVSLSVVVSLWTLYLSFNQSTLREQSNMYDIGTDGCCMKLDPDVALKN